MYVYLTHLGKFYLPNLSRCSIWFMKDVMQGKKDVRLSLSTVDQTEWSECYKSSLGCSVMTFRRI